MAMGCRVAGVCSVSGRAEGAGAPAAARAPRSAVRLGSSGAMTRLFRSPRCFGVSRRGGVCVATLMEQPNTYARKPEDVLLRWLLHASATTFSVQHMYGAA